MTVRELRAMFLEFFESKGHVRMPSGSLVPYDVTGRLDESLLFNGAGMVQFKPYFRGVAEPRSRRATTSQKCLRTGDIESVGNPNHLTFFEMLGNFSFGDYFKAEAIAYSWEFLTDSRWLGLDPKRLAFTVFEDDDEAYDEWAKHLSASGILPETRIFRLGEETNYWPAGSFSAGPPGPCGPNSEMFYWVPQNEPPPTIEGVYAREDYLRDDAQGKWLEIWNDVFIQYEWQGEELASGGFQKTGMPPLPFASIDTGMGIERTVVVLNGLSSVYETDAFTGILDALANLSDHDDMSARRIIADHFRAAAFCIADGVLPSNTGRGYVLRRLIRRAVLKGSRRLGLAEPFLHRLVGALVETFATHYTELAEKRDVIVETLRNEEALFRRTLEKGTELLLDALDSVPPGGVLSGEAAFRLHDTFGFPLEVTQELAAEQGRLVDIAGYQAAMASAQARSRGADQRESVYGGVVIAFRFETADGPTETVFRGYEVTSCMAKVKGALPVLDDAGRATGEVALALDQTPFYAASGGQVADTGVVRFVQSSVALHVSDVARQDGVIVHLASPEAAIGIEGASASEATDWLNLNFFDHDVQATVKVLDRADTVRHHTATHLLHAALRAELGTHVTQAGSLVSPEHLRFDFTHGAAMEPAELDRVEALVNAEVLRAQSVVTYEDVPIEDARRMGAMALFGEKYADRVRVVQVGGMSPSEPSFSRELCGGIHVRNTGEIGLFKILHEGSAASGVRRIEAVAGLRAYAWALDQERTIREASQRLKSSPSEIGSAIERTLEQLREERRKRERLAQQGGGADVASEQIGPYLLLVQSAEGLGPEDAKAMADRLVDGKPEGVALVFGISEGKVAIVCKVGKDALAAGAHGGNIVKAAAQATGGGGGGRPDFATAGGRDPSKIAQAIEAVRQVLS
ncbi:MAG: alanine--tRNA ligase [Fimbriimonadaceae bacterium]|nr:alanine--tRNA ligase [Fimbriimonadaceae bacterium]